METHTIDINSKYVADCIERIDQRVIDCVKELFDLVKKAEGMNFPLNEKELSKYYVDS